jgi:hypothetical protein
MTLTIELPDDLADRAAAAGLAPTEVSRYAIAGAVAAVTVAADQAQAADQTADSAEIADVIEEADALHKAGERGVPADEVFANLRVKLAAARAAAV